MFKFFKNLFKKNPETRSIQMEESVSVDPEVQLGSYLMWMQANDLIKSYKCIRDYIDKIVVEKGRLIEIDNFGLPEVRTDLIDKFVRIYRARFTKCDDAGFNEWITNYAK